MTFGGRFGQPIDLPDLVQFWLALHRKRDAFGGLYPLIVVCERAIRFYGVDDGVAGDRDFGAAFQDSFEDVAEICAAAGSQAYRFEVTIKGPYRHAVMLGDYRGMAPFDVFLFNSFAVGIAADLAFAGVSLHGGIWLIFTGRLP